MKKKSQEAAKWISQYKRQMRQNCLGRETQKEVQPQKTCSLNWVIHPAHSFGTPQKNGHWQNGSDIPKLHL